MGRTLSGARGRFGVFGLALLLLLVFRAGAALADPGYNVYVGYADKLRSSATAFPTPFDAAPGILHFGDASSNPNLDSGAVRIVNSSGVSETINSISVDVGTAHFALWPANILLPAGDQAVFDETGGAQNFDTSDAPSITCTPDHLTPQVNVKVDGASTTYADTGQVLNTGGIDPANCGGGNESRQWVSIGQPPCPTGATLSLTPPTQTESVGALATVTANFSSCGTPLPGATVQFTIVSGPNAGAHADQTVGPSGNASFTYSSSLTGTDTVQAVVVNAAGTIFSNSVTVVWTKARTSLQTTPPPPVPVGGTIGADSATLSGGFRPTGSIVFTLSAPGDTTCSNPIFSRTVPVSGNGSYSSGAVGQVTTPGTYRWEVAYLGDVNNAAALSPCGAEQTDVTPQVLTGRAFGLSLGGLLKINPTPDTGSVSTTSSTTVAPPCVVSLPVGTAVVAKVLCASVKTSSGFPADSQAFASTAGANVALSGLPKISIGVVQAFSSTSCAGSSGSTTIASLKIGSKNVLPSPTPIKPNTTINVGILKVVLNQQIPIKGSEKGLTVNAIHITSTSNLHPNLINLIVASASSDIGNCP
jgi:hypothetical protein